MYKCPLMKPLFLADTGRGMTRPFGDVEKSKLEKLPTSYAENSAENGSAFG